MFKWHFNSLKFFTQSKVPPNDLCDLLSRTTLGTNGARYQHLDTPDRLKEMDNPLYLSLIRNNKTIANVTFCKRNVGWYVRYFAFDGHFQSIKTNKTNTRKSSFLKKELKQFFLDRLNVNDTNQFYAYVDAENERSIRMTETFGFKRIAQLETNSFSRIRPKCKLQLATLKDKAAIKSLVLPVFQSKRFFTPYHILNSKGSFYAVYQNNEVVAFGKFYKANWKIHALPGKNGQILVKILPFIPIINRVINPERFSFLVPEAVWIRDNNKELLSNFFESVLQKEKHKTIMWWNASNDSLLNAVKSQIKWGLLSKLSKPKKVDLVALSQSDDTGNQKDEIYTVGIDFI